MTDALNDPTPWALPASPVHAALAYYKACAARQRPEWVPATVMVLRTVRPDLPFFGSGFVRPGATPVECNQWGAVSARASDGTLLGLKPDEFDVLTWVRAQ